MCPLWGKQEVLVFLLIHEVNFEAEILPAWANTVELWPYMRHPPVSCSITPHDLLRSDWPRSSQSYTVTASLPAQLFVGVLEELILVAVGLWWHLMAKEKTTQNLRMTETTVTYLRVDPDSKYILYFDQIAISLMCFWFIGFFVCLVLNFHLPSQVRYCVSPLSTVSWSCWTCPRRPWMKTTSSLPAADRPGILHPLSAFPQDRAHSAEMRRRRRGKDEPGEINK